MKTKLSSLYGYTGSLFAVIGVLFFALFFLFTVTNLGDVGTGRLLENPVTLISAACMIIIVPIIATIYFNKADKREIQEYINRSVLRYVIATLMVFYGFGKIGHKFFDITYVAQDTKLSEVDSFFLVWYFFGRSNVQEIIIGIMEFLPGLLLLYRRTSFIAALILLPVELNVLMVNTFNHVSGLTFPLAIFISLANIYLLWGWREQIADFLKRVGERTRVKLGGPLKWLRLLFKTVVIGMIGLMVLGGIISKINGAEHSYLYNNKIKGGYELAELKIEGVPVSPKDNDSIHYSNIYLEPQMRWNSVRTFSKSLQGITIRWNKHNDSVSTFLRKDLDVTNDAVDPSTKFTGVYMLRKDTLYVNGLQYGKQISAKYIKEHLVDYNWFW